jgi:hypothetical protein
LPTYTPHLTGLLFGSCQNPVYHQHQALSPEMVSFCHRHAPRAPLPLRGVTPKGAAFTATWKGITLPSSLLRAHAPDQIPPTSFSLWPGWRVYAGCGKPLLGDGPSRRYLCNPCVGAWTPYPAVSSRCNRSFLPGRQRPHVRRHTFGTLDHPRNATSTGFVISGLQSFRYVQAPTLARPPGCTHRRGLNALGAAGPFTPPIARLVTCHGLWYRYVSDTSN